MKTPILYVLTSSESDLYLEELWVSLFSLHYFNKEVTVKVLSDKPTAESDNLVKSGGIYNVVSKLKQDTILLSQKLNDFIDKEENKYSINKLDSLLKLHENKDIQYWALESDFIDLNNCLLK